MTFFYEKKWERFWWFLTYKTNFESQILGLFDTSSLQQLSKFNNLCTYVDFYITGIAILNTYFSFCKFLTCAPRESFDWILLSQQIFCLTCFYLGVVHKLRWQDFGFSWPPTPLRWQFLSYKRWQKLDIFGPPTYLVL